MYLFFLDVFCRNKISFMTAIPDRARVYHLRYSCSRCHVVIASCMHSAFSNVHDRCAEYTQDMCETNTYTQPKPVAWLSHRTIRVCSEFGHFEGLCSSLQHCCYLSLNLMHQKEIVLSSLLSSALRLPQCFCSRCFHPVPLFIFLQ